MKKNLFLIITVFIISFTLHSQKRELLKDSLLYDVQILEGIFLEAHPGIFRYNTNNEFSNIFKDLRNDITTDLSYEEWMLKLAKAVKKIKCGHTYLNPWNMKPYLREKILNKSIYFPMAFDIIDSEFIVTNNVSQNKDIKKGDRILEINGLKTSRILDSLTLIAKQDGNNRNSIAKYLSLNELGATRWEAFDIYFNLFFPVKETFEVKYEKFKSKDTATANLIALTKNERAKADELKFNEKKWLSYSDGEIYILKLGTFATWNWKDFDYKVWLKTEFDKISKLKPKTLVIDIRGNEGGLGDIRIELLSYLTNKPIYCDEKAKVLSRTIKVDPFYEQFSETWVENIFSGLPEESYTIFNDEFYELKESLLCETIKPKENNFKGDIYIFSDGTNVSATSRLIEAGKQFDNTYIVGTPTGGNQQGINGGEYLFFYLPYSKMEVDVPLKFFKGSSDDDGGIEPDFFVEYSQRDIVDGYDPILALTKSLIQSKNKVNNEYITRMFKSKNWRGSLKYLDKSSNNYKQISSVLKVTELNDNRINFDFIYPKKELDNNSVKVDLDLKNRLINEEPIISLELLDGGEVIIVTAFDDLEKNKSVKLKKTYKVSQRHFEITEEIKNNSSVNYQIRTQYAFEKKPLGK